MAGLLRPDWFADLPNGARRRPLLWEECLDRFEARPLPISPFTLEELSDWAFLSRSQSVVTIITTEPFCFKSFWCCCRRCFWKRLMAKWNEPWQKRGGGKKQRLFQSRPLLLVQNFSLASHRPWHACYVRYANEEFAPHTNTAACRRYVYMPHIAFVYSLSAERNKGCSLNKSNRRK